MFVAGVLWGQRSSCLQAGVMGSEVIIFVAGVLWGQRSSCL